jgi:hypothetical protein
MLDPDLVVSSRIRRVFGMSVSVVRAIALFAIAERRFSRIPIHEFRRLCVSPFSSRAPRRVRALKKAVTPR